ncbi:importin alpha re-exporter [[Candida] railenensis]|uniref:Importin alpha re-exporter n=1 Tax=[Candida] railenensis TaxID=45579 RepID=A0A9P0VXC6_9ASCO|nr:importin alpha re-exporter [[Candida] railenensis]
MSLEALSSCLELSLQPQHAKQAESQLKSQESSPGFPITLLQVISSKNLQLPIRQAGAVFFKNLIRRKWSNEDGQHLFTPADVAYVKTEIVNIMIQLPNNLQIQLGESISIIAESDFPHQWEGLIDELVGKLSPTDFLANKAILIVAHSIFKKWRPLFRSDELFLEIKHVLDKFAEPFLQLLTKVDHNIDEALAKGDKASLIIYLDNLLLLIQIYYDLNCQDIPEFFEDNMNRGMAIMHKYLTLQTKLVTDPNDDDEVDVLIKIKTSIVELISLYISRYADIFEPLIESFITTVWNMLIGQGDDVYVTKQPKFDLCVVKSLSFLTSVTKMATYSGLFNNESSIKEIIEKIILPNIYFREVDEELFEDEPIQYVRSDLEGSDFDTRRKSATDFLRELKDVNSELVTNTVMTYVNQFLQANEADWKNKDIAIYLFSSLAAKGSVTNVGVTSTNVLVDVVKFFSENIAKYLINSTNDTHPILKSDAIKYIFTFRNQLTKEQLVQIFPMLFSHLQETNTVVYTFTAITIEKLLSMTSFTDINHSPVFTSSDIQPFAQDLLTHLFQLILQNSSAPEKLSENEFLIKCIMRVLITAESEAITAEFRLSLIEQLLKMISIISTNPSNPKFSHYVFESLGLLIKYSNKSNISNLIQVILPSLLTILGNDVQEFVPYTFQILAFMLEELPSSEPLPESYTQLIKPLLSPSVWEFRGNIPGITRLLIAILKQDPQVFVETEQSLTPLLGVFQKLIASKVNDVYGFELLEAIFLYIPLNFLNTYVKQIAVVLLTRLKASRTEKYVKRFVVFIFSLTCIPLNPELNQRTHGLVNSDFVINFIDSVQDGGLFAQIFNSFILPTTASFANLQDRKIATLGLSEIIHSSHFTSTYGQLLVPTVEQLLTNVKALGGIQREVSLAANGATVMGGAASVSTFNELDLESSAFGSTFSKIISISPKPFDPLPEIKGNDQATIKQAVLTNLKRLGQDGIFSQLSVENQQVLKELGL